MNGIIIALEGLDGAGKTIQSKNLAQKLVDQKYPVSLYREPSDTITGRFLRHYLSIATTHDPQVQTGLFLAAHAELMHDQVLPDLELGKIVVMDRFSPSAIAYQCARHGVPKEPVQALYDHANRGYVNTQIILLDITPELSVARTQARTHGKADIYDMAKLEERATTRNGYLDQAKESPHNWHIIDGDATIEAVANSILETTRDILAAF